MKLATKIILVVLVAALVIYDIVAASVGEGATISEVTLGWSYRWSWVPYGSGVVVAHLWWPSKSTAYHWQRAVVLGVLSAGVICIDIWVVETLFPLWALLLGGTAGKLLWAQKALPAK